MKLVDNVIKADATLGVKVVEPYDDTELRERVEALEEKPDKDTIYDDTALTERVTALENKPDKDTVYDDTAIKASVKANTDALGGHTVKSDVPADAKFTDTVYDDSEIKHRVAVNASDIADVNNHLEQGLQMVQAKQDATPSSALTDPAGTGIQLVANQKIDYDKLADAIIAKYQGQTLAGKAQSVKSALDTVRSVQDQTIKAEDSSTPCSYSAGDFFVYDGKLYKASADFSSVTLTADNISTYAEAQTQTAINALNQSLLSGVRIVEHWKYRPAYKIPAKDQNGQLELDFSKYVNAYKYPYNVHPYGDNFLIFANTVHNVFALFGFISLVSTTMTFCKGIIESGLSLSFTNNDDNSIHTIIIKNNHPYEAGIRDVYILRLS